MKAPGKEELGRATSSLSHLAARINVFRTIKTFSYSGICLNPVVQDLIQAFENEGFSSHYDEFRPGAWKITFYKGHAGWSAIGMRQGLDVTLESTQGEVRVGAGIGLLKGSSQVLILHKQKSLDDFAVDIIETSLNVRGAALPRQ